MYSGSRARVSSCIAIKGLIFNCHLESAISAGTVTSKEIDTYPALSATFLKRAVTLEALMTSVATISPVSESRIAFIINGPSDKVPLMLSISTPLSSSGSMGFSSETDNPICTCLSRIRCILRCGAQEAITTNISSTSKRVSEDIGNRYHKFIRQEEVLSARLDSEAAQRAGIAVIEGHSCPAS